ncbi:MAG TPA: hypothetical protein VG013_36035, partial [Gemmataceae bacterium]|nr:hypothetical protein [Gemmataceae bacterium]
MAKFNASQYHWDKVFQPTAPLPQLPAELTKRWWDSKKSLIAKLTKATGVGAALTRVETAFRGVTFQPYNPHVTKVDATTKEFLTFITSSPVTAFQTALRDLRDLAKDQAEECRRSKVIPKGTADALDDIVNNADQLSVVVNQHSLRGSLERAIAVWQRDQGEKVRRLAEGNLKAAKDAMANIPQHIQAARSKLGPTTQITDQVRTDVGESVRKACRVMNQPLGNLVKAVKAGVQYDNLNATQAEQLYNALSP